MESLPTPKKFLGALALAATFMVGSAHAAIVEFSVFENDAGDFTGELEYSLVGGNFVTTIRNTSSTGSSHIKDIYFETPAGSALSNPMWTNTDVSGNTDADIIFSLESGTQNPPGAGGTNPNLTDQWVGTDFWFSADPPPSKKGLVPGQELTITWDTSGIPADAAFRVAVHVGDCMGNNSCTAITGLGLEEGGGSIPPEAVVPIPAAAWLFGSALLGLVGVARRKKA